MKRIALVASLVVAAVASAQDELVRPARCPLDGDPFDVRVPVAWNEGGGRDSDGCRWGVAPRGAFVALELRELAGCPRCGLALYRGHLEAAARAVRDPAAVRSALAALPRDDSKEALVARAAATYRAIGHAALGVGEDPEAFEGLLALRAAWAVREQLVAEPTPFVFAPRMPEDARDRLLALHEQGTAARADGGVRAATGVDEALAALDRARGAAAAASSDPAERLRAARRQRALDRVERFLLGQRREERAAAPGMPAGLALAIVRAAVREGDVARRDWWLGALAEGERRTVRALCEREQEHLRRASSLLASAAERASGDRRAELLALAADAARRADRPDEARDLARRALEASPASRRATHLLERLGE